MARATKQACIGPAPPKLVSTKSRGSRPRLMMTFLTAWAMISQLMRTMASAVSTTDSPSWRATPSTARSAAARLRVILPPSVGSSRPSSRLASVTVGSLPPAP